MDVQVSLRALVKVHDDLLVYLDDFSAFRLSEDKDCGEIIGYDLVGYSKEEKEWVYLWAYWRRNHGDIEGAHARARLDLNTIFEAQVALDEIGQ